MKNILNDDQRLVVEGNLDVIHQVIHKYFYQYLSSLEYDDLYQAGAVGLCKAAMTYQSDYAASFSSYAYVVIKNEIYDYLRKSLRNKALTIRYSEQVKGNLEKHYGIPVDKEICEVLTYTALTNTKKKYKKTTRTGIEALSMTIQGYSCKDIAEKFDMDLNHITACISRAKKCLRNDQNFLDEIL